MRITLGDNRTEVDIPDSLLAAFDSGEISRFDLMKHAIDTGQATPQDFTGQDERGFFDVMGESAAASISRLGSNINQAMASLSGDEEREALERDRQLRLDRFISGTFQERPIASFLGQAAPFAIVPGGKVAQGIAGGIQGGLEGDTARGRVLGALGGAALGVGGAKLGDFVGSQLQRGTQNIFRTANAPGRNILSRAGVRLTPAQRISADSFIGRFNRGFAELFDELKQSVTPGGGQPLRAAQVRTLTSKMVRALGGKGNRVTPQVIRSAEDTLSSQYDNVAGAVDSVLLPQNLLDDFDNFVLGTADGLDSAGLKNQLFAAANELKRGVSGRRFLQLRRFFSQKSAELGNATDGDVARAARSRFDDMLLASFPEAAETLQNANQAWQVLEIARTPNVLNPRGEINTKSAFRAFERFFPELSGGRIRNPLAAPVALPLQALREAAPGTVSLTPDVLRAGGLAAGLSAAGGASLGPVGVGLGILPFLGGGTGGLAGGASARSLIGPTIAAARDRGFLEDNQARNLLGR